MHAKAKVFIENFRTEPSRTSPLNTHIGHRGFEKNKQNRADKSPVASQRFTGPRHLLKSPDTNCPMVFSTRYNRSTANIAKLANTNRKMATGAVTKEMTQSFHRTSEAPSTSCNRSDLELDQTSRTVINTKSFVDSELTESLKRYKGGFSAYEDSCITTYCVKHQDAKTEFYTNFGQLMVGFCATCAVKYASQSVSVHPYKPVRAKQTKKEKIDQFLAQIADSKPLLVQKRVDLVKAQKFLATVSVSSQQHLLDTLFEDLILSFQKQKPAFIENFAKYLANAKLETEEKLESLTVESGLIRRIESDIADNYQSILDNVSQYDFDLTLAHHQMQFSERVKLVENLESATPRILSEMDALKIKERLFATLEEEITKIFPGMDTRAVKVSLPTFKNFSPQNPDKSTNLSIPTPVELKSEKQSARDQASVSNACDSAFKNIPSIDNFLEANPSEQVLTDSHRESFIPHEDSSAHFWEENKGNCFLSVDPNK